MSYCSNCGKELRKGDKYCSECGHNVQKSDGGSGNGFSWWDNMSKGQKKLMLITVITIIVAIFIISRENESPQPYPQNTVTSVLGQDVTQGPAQVQKQTVQKVQCPICGGIGKTGTMGDDFMASTMARNCTACGGTGMIDQNTAQQLRNAQQQFNNIYGTTNEGGGNSSSSSNSKECWNCNGSGKCSGCAGRGEIRYTGLYGSEGGKTDCPICHGTGRCQACHGRGKN